MHKKNKRLTSIVIIRIFHFFASTRFTDKKILAVLKTVYFQKLQTFAFFCESIILFILEIFILFFF